MGNNSFSGTASMEGRPKRLLTVTVRGAADLPKPVSKPFVVVELAGTTVGSTDVAQAAGANPVWDESFSCELPPPLPGEKPLEVKVRIMNRVRFFADSLVAGGSTTLSDLLYGAGKFEDKVKLSDKAGRAAGHLHLGLEREREAAPGENVGSAAGKVLGEDAGPPGSPTAAGVPGPVLPSAEGAEMQAREILGAGGLVDPSKPAFGLHTA